MWGLNPSVDSVSLFFAKSRLPGRETRESQTLTFLADALSVLDRLRRSAGTVLRKWKTIPAKAVGTAAPPICFRPQPLESRLPAATYDALLAEDCGLSAGILSTTRAIYKRVSCEVAAARGSGPGVPARAARVRWWMRRGLRIDPVATALGTDLSMQENRQARV